MTNKIEHREDGTTIIHLSLKGATFECVIDTEDYPKVESFYWGVLKGRNTVYAATGAERCCMQHVIMDSKGIDHRDGNGLNNRKNNLRHSTERQNASNRKKQAGAYTSTFKGVCFTQNKWKTQINGKLVGWFATELEAAQAYNAAAVIEHGEFAVLNKV